jgi:hypothetical protein
MALDSALSTFQDKQDGCIKIVLKPWNGFSSINVTKNCRE